MKKIASILSLCAALSLVGVDLASARPRQSKRFEPNINITTQRSNSFLGFPLNQNTQTYSANKNGVQVKNSQGDFFSRNSNTFGIKRNGQIKIDQRSNNGWPF